jgi:hypothetical protein
MPNDLPQTWLTSGVLPADDALPPGERIAAAIAAVRAFRERFNAQDPTGMDGWLHFPHLVLSGGRLVVWQAPGRITAVDFEQLAAAGWNRSEFRSIDPVLVSTGKVHLLVDYTRNRLDGSLISAHRNLWIVTLEADRWGIKVRSY